MKKGVKNVHIDNCNMCVDEGAIGLAMEKRCVDFLMLVSKLSIRSCERFILIKPKAVFCDA